MRIGLIVEGQAEFDAIPRLATQLSAITSATFVGPLFVRVDPTARPEQIAQGCQNALVVLERKRTQRIVLLLDREQQPICCGIRCSVVADALKRKTTVPVDVVLKDRTFENWLIADLEAIKALPGRFKPSRTALRQVSPDKADAVDGYRWLENASDRTYDKRKDAIRILERADVDRIAGNSRSFRRFLRVVGHPAYAAQSRRPAVI